MNLVKKVERFAKENLDEVNLEHSKRVRKIALKIAKNENANKEIVEMASWLHDIAKPKNPGLDHHIKGMEMSREFFQKIDADQNVAEEVIKCIESHMMKSDLPDAPRHDTIEAKVVFDADMINMISPFGISKLIFIFSKEGKDFNESIETVKKIAENGFKELQTETGKARPHYQGGTGRNRTSGQPR